MSDISVVFNDFLLAVHVCHKCLLLTYIDITYNDHQVNVGVCMSFTLPFLLSRDMGKKKNDKSCMGLSWGICIKSQLTLLKLPLSLVLWRVFFFKYSDWPLYGSHKGRTVHQNYTNRICSEILLKSWLSWSAMQILNVWTEHHNSLKWKKMYFYYENQVISLTVPK